VQLGYPVIEIKISDWLKAIASIIGIHLVTSTIPNNIAQ
jgi:hypothetical protein